MEQFNKVLYEVGSLKKSVNKCIEKEEFDIRFNTLMKEIEKKFVARPTMKYV